MVKRYWPQLNGFDGLEIVEAEDGEYVKYDDYAELRRLFDELCADIAALDSVSEGLTEKT